MVLSLEKSRGKFKFAESVWDVGGTNWGSCRGGESFRQPSYFPVWRCLNVTKQWSWVTSDSWWRYQGSSWDKVGLSVKAMLDFQQPMGYATPTSHGNVFTGAHLLRRKGHAIQTNNRTTDWGRSRDETPYYAFANSPSQLRWSGSLTKQSSM